jgi:hypothetical protein
VFLKNLLFPSSGYNSEGGDSGVVKTLVPIYQTTQCHMLEDCNLNYSQRVIIRRGK